MDTDGDTRWDNPRYGLLALRNATRQSIRCSGADLVVRGESGEGSGSTDTRARYTRPTDDGQGHRHDVARLELQDRVLDEDR